MQKQNGLRIVNERASRLLPVIRADQIDAKRPDPLDDITLEKTKAILADIRQRKNVALRHYAKTFGDRKPDQPLILSKNDLIERAREVPKKQLQLLERVAGRIRVFAEKQLACLKELDTDVPGGRAGHRNIAVESAGCYAPGGRYPLPSSVLMTVIPARVAGVRNVWVASPRPAPITIAAAAVAGADALLAVGGAQAIGAFAYGTETIPSCDIIVGPGNRWVTAAKLLVAGHVNIDMLAGPSELVIVADSSADPSMVAFDLLAQAEHDVDALPVLIANELSVIDAVRSKLVRFLSEFPTETAEQSLGRGFSLRVPQLRDAVEIVNRIAPEHLQLIVDNPTDLVPGLRNYGGLFIGAQTAEVFGDYGVGPNHVLPTSGAARRSAGLSVTTFLHQPTWLRMNQSDELHDVIDDTATLAELEGLKWHARAARARLVQD